MISIGDRFHNLTVVEALGSRPYGQSGKKRKYWKCQCDCGNFKECHTTQLTAGWSKSCGCLKAKVLQERNHKHGMRHTPQYVNWRKMKDRCNNPNFKDYHLYGGRGISYIPSWGDFEEFWKDMGDTWFEGATLERKNSNLNYSKENCTWIPNADQAKNRRYNIWLMADGQKMYLKQFCEAYGYPYNRVKDRINGKSRRWSLEDALFTEASAGRHLAKKEVPPWWGDTVYQIDYDGNRL